MAVYRALLEKGDTVMGMNLSHGGHLTHGHPINFSGTDYKIIGYDVNPKTELIDYDEVERLLKKISQKWLLQGQVLILE